MCTPSRTPALELARMYRLAHERSGAPLLGDMATIHAAAAATEDGERCMVTADPDLADRLSGQLAAAAAQIDGVSAVSPVLPGSRDRFGLNDGLIIPGTSFPLGTPSAVVRNVAADRAPLRGAVRVIVVLVEFSDAQMNESVQHYEDLFFSSGSHATGSVRDYYKEASNGLIDIQGDVVGPYQLPKTLAEYAHGESGMGAALPNARTMARHAVEASNVDVNFAPYDNDGNGYVDAFIVVHAGGGAEQTGSTGDIWSHKWVLEPGEVTADSTKIFAYLTIPEDARLGVSAHELGHLLFGWPDLYDTDYSSNGIGNWCLMAGGSWNNAGDTPAHPSAWCKSNQGWVTVVNQTSNGLATIADVKDGQQVWRLWKDGAASPEYFLVENRQRSRFDAHLPDGGLLIWHIDEATPNNTNENHYKVALVQADGSRHLELKANRGDGGDCYPGSADNRTFSKTSTPSSQAYSGADTCVQVSQISNSGPSMTAQMVVRCGILKRKEITIDKRLEKRIEKRIEKSFIADKRPEKPVTDKRVGFDKGFDKPIDGRPGDFGRPGGSGRAGEGGVEELEARVAAIEALLSGGAAAQPFIGGELRPDLSGGAYMEEQDAPSGDQYIGDPFEKRLLDSPGA